MGTEVLRGKSFKGFLATEEAELLYTLAREAALRGPCLEIGSYCGQSAAYLGLGCREVGGLLFTIDHHAGSEEQQPGQPYFDPDLLDPRTGRIDTLPWLRKTLRELGLEQSVVPIVASAETLAGVWGTPLSLLFIDGGHAFRAAFNDYSGWVSHLMPGGYLLIHDLFADPTQGGQAPLCIYRLAVDSGLFHELPAVGTLGVLKRASPGSLTGASERAWSRLLR
jgi:hypothetical protein